MHCSMTNMVSVFDEIFNVESCNELAKKHQFIQRSSSRIQGHDFIKTLIIPNSSLSEDSLNGLCVRLSQYNSNANISASALSQRINKRAAVEFMKACLQLVLRSSREKMVKQYTSLEGVLTSFENIYIQDSTVFELNKHLHKVFEGTKRGGKKGGTSCKSQVKIDLIHNYTLGVIEEAKIYSGKVPDQALTGKILNIIKKRDLVIRDLGYFKLKTLKSIIEQDAYFLTRLPSNVKVYLNFDDKMPVDLARHFDKKYENCPVIDMTVWIGDERIPVRLVAYRIPQEITNQRLRKAHKGAKEMGRTLSKAKINLMRFSIFVTNIPEQMITPEMIGTIYRLRWEIELIFKQWKSLLKIDVLKGTNRYRVECLIWSRLCMVMIVAFITARYMNMANKLCSGELSPTKLINYLTRDGSLCEAIRNNNIEKFEMEMEKDMKNRLLKDQRLRPTMRERVSCSWGYYEKDKNSQRVDLK